MSFKYSLHQQSPTFLAPQRKGGWFKCTQPNPMHAQIKLRALVHRLCGPGVGDSCTISQKITFANHQESSAIQSTENLQSYFSRMISLTIVCSNIYHRCPPAVWGPLTPRIPVSTAIFNPKEAGWKMLLQTSLSNLFLLHSYHTLRLQNVVTENSPFPPSKYALVVLY